MKKVFILASILIAIVSCTSKPNAEATFFVRGNCGMCKERIDKTVSDIKGVEKASWDVESKTIHVSYDSTVVSTADIEKAVAATGHATKSVPMDSTANSKLPECCRAENADMH